MKKTWTIGKTRSVLYKSGKALGDFNALKKGEIGGRITNRILGNVSMRIANKLSHKMQKFFKNQENS